MTEESKLQPGFAATTLYDNFDDFIKHYEQMNYWRRFDSLPIQCLVRLARDDFQKARRVYNWAVRVPMLRQLAGTENTTTPSLLFLKKGSSKSKLPPVALVKTQHSP